MENNKIVPLKAGTTTVTITADNGVSKTVKLKVKQAPKELYADNLEVEIGETKTIHVYTDVSDPDTDNDNSLYEFENTDNSVCAVNVKGEVTGILVGTSKVKVTNSSGLETTMTVNVVPKTAHMTLTLAHLRIPKAPTKTLKISPQKPLTTPIPARIAWEVMNDETYQEVRSTAPCSYLHHDGSDWMCG